MIFIIDDDLLMAKCIGRACQTEYRMFADAFSAMDAITAGNLPDLIFLDVLLSGPDSFTFLNELSSYEDTAQIPVVIVSSLELARRNLENYGVVGFLNKDTMLPAEIRRFVEKYTKEAINV